MDEIPYFKVGDEVSISASDEHGKGRPFPCRVIETSLVNAIVESKVGFHYFVDYKTGKITTLDEWQRCVVCGRFICSCNKEENEIDMSDLKPIPFEELKGYAADQNIPQVEGTIKILFDPEGGKYPKQNGYIVDSDGTEHRLTFAVNELIRDKDEWRGKKVRITSNFSKRSPTGVKMKVEGKNGEYRKIWVSGSAKIEELNGDASSPPAGKSNSGGGGRTTGGVAGSKSHVSRRVFDYFRIMSEVKKGYEAMKEEYNLPEFTTEDFRSVTTGISMGFKGQYGVYADPIFRIEGDGSQSTDARKDTVSSWRDFVHPTKEVTLGDVAGEDEDKLLEWIVWAFSYEGKAEASVKLQHALLNAAGDLKVAPKNALEMKIISNLGVLSSLHKDTLDTFAQDEYGVSWKELEDDDCSVILRSKDALKTIESIDKKNKENEEKDEELPD